MRGGSQTACQDEARTLTAFVALKDLWPTVHWQPRESLIPLYVDLPTVPYNTSTHGLLDGRRHPKPCITLPLPAHSK